jgi:hypothetical protein
MSNHLLTIAYCSFTIILHKSLQHGILQRQSIYLSTCLPRYIVTFPYPFSLIRFASLKGLVHCHAEPLVTKETYAPYTLCTYLETTGTDIIQILQLENTTPRRGLLRTLWQWRTKGSQQKPGACPEIRFPTRTGSDLDGQGMTSRTRTHRPRGIIVNRPDNYRRTLSGHTYPLVL